MDLPFSRVEFLDVFGAYNTALWPAVIVFWIATAGALWPVFRNRTAGRLLSGLLALHWAWAGLVYHALFFARINPAAWLFAALFLIQAGAFFWLGVIRHQINFVLDTSPKRLLAAGLIVYALLYPLLVMATGHTYPRMPVFAVPCPTALLTAGLVLMAEPLPPRWFSVIPIIWCLIGTSAAFALGMLPDTVLLIAALLLLINLVAPRIFARQVAAVA